MIFFRDLIESPEVDAKAEGAVLLLDEEDRHCAKSSRGRQNCCAGSHPRTVGGPSSPFQKANTSFLLEAWHPRQGLF